MGMDVIGLNPTSQTGRYFCNNISWWHPLASYCEQVAPHITAACKFWHSNDMDGLDAAGAIALAKILQAAIDNGAVARKEKFLEAYKATLPKVACFLCKGSGKARGTIPDDAPVLRKNPDHPCLVCGGDGTLIDGDYEAFSEANVRGFVDFLRACGGFQIW